MKAAAPAAVVAVVAGETASNTQPYVAEREDCAGLPAELAGAAPPNWDCCEIANK